MRAKWQLYLFTSAAPATHGAAAPAGLSHAANASIVGVTAASRQPATCGTPCKTWHFALQNMAFRHAVCGLSHGKRPHIAEPWKMTRNFVFILIIF